MKSPEYQRLARRSGELSDEFYRCVSTWARNSSAVAAKKCVDLARDYESALKEQIAYLKKRASVGPRGDAIKSCETYLKMLEDQLRMLEKGGSDH